MQKGADYSDGRNRGDDSQYGKESNYDNTFVLEDSEAESSSTSSSDYESLYSESIPDMHLSNSSSAINQGIETTSSGRGLRRSGQQSSKPRSRSRV
jgi:hypothetical protein